MDKNVFFICKRNKIGFVFKIFCAFFVVFGAPNSKALDFSAYITVNDFVITGYEFEQRLALLETLFGTKDMSTKQVELDLIRERLQEDEAEKYNLSVSEMEIKTAISQLASQFDLDADMLVFSFEETGISEASLRAYLHSSILWGHIVRARFGDLLTITDSEVERTAYVINSANSTEVKISEIILFARTEEELERASLFLERSRSKIRSDAGFSEFARLHSVAPSAAAGGEIGWRNLAELPQDISNVFLKLPLGGITEPFQLGEVLAVFRLLDFKEAPLAPSPGVILDYMILDMPARATSVHDFDFTKFEAQLTQVNQCNDLYRLAADNSAVQLTRKEQRIDEIPRVTRIELAKLDADEISMPFVKNAQTEHERISILMLCRRSNDLDIEDLETLRSALLERKFQNLAKSYSEELLARAVVSYP